MISNLVDKDLPTKNGHTGADKITSRSRFWLGLKDPRIVRVSRAFGGKDRHSKVSTIRGLRDRRVRLSVQTAIQLYDLQDKLGLSQPSKVVDWLLNAAQEEIDKLPPLPIPPNFMHFSQALASSDEAAAPQWHACEKLKHESGGAQGRSAVASHQLGLSSAKRSNLGNDQAVQDAMEFTKSAVGWNSGATADGKAMEGEAPPTDHSGFEKNSGSKAADTHNFSAQAALANFPFSRLSHSSLPGMALGNLPYATSFYHLETAANAYDQHHLGSHTSKLLEAAASNPSMSSQLVFCASGGMPMFSSFLTNAELNPKQYHIQVAAASANLQLGSVASQYQSTAGVAVARPSPASLAFRHHYPDS